MKGFETIQYLSFIAFGLIFVLLGIVLVLNIVNAMANPERLTAKANFDRLAAAINEVCATKRDINNPIEINVNLPQAYSESFFGRTVRNIREFFGLYKWQMKLDGDPHYVIYYEMFPPGEDIGWEVYQDFDYRIIAAKDFRNNPHPQDLIESIRNSPSLSSYQNAPILLANVILSDEFNPLSGNVSKSWGKWDSSGNYYSFDSYIGLNTLEKTFIKYVACGDNSLCMKTRDGVYRYHLDQCENNGIDYIQLVNDIPWWEINYIEEEEGQYRDITQSKRSDFYLASPCRTTTKVKIYYDEHCENEYNCEKAVKVPIYKFNGENLEKVGDHIYCLQTLKRSQNLPDYTESIPCIKVEFEFYDGFCYTRNLEPKLPGWYNFWYGLPVTMSTIFDKDKELFILNQTSNFRNNFYEAMKRAAYWGWPG